MWQDPIVDEVRQAIGADELFYQEIEDLFDAVHKGNPKITNACMACFTGKYPTPEVTAELLAEAERLRGCERMQDFEYDSNPAMHDEVSEGQLSIL